MLLYQTLDLVQEQYARIKGEKEVEKLKED